MTPQPPLFVVPPSDGAVASPIASVMQPLLGCRYFFIRRFGLIAEEFFSSLKVIIGLSIVVWFALILQSLVYPPHSFPNFFQNRLSSDELLLLSIAVAYLLGLTSSTEEIENNHRLSLLILPLSPFRVLASKLLAHGGALLLFNVLLLPFSPWKAVESDWFRNGTLLTLWLHNAPIRILPAIPFMLLAAWSSGLSFGALLGHLVPAALFGLITAGTVFHSSALAAAAQPTPLTGTLVFSALLLAASLICSFAWARKNALLESAVVTNLFPERLSRILGAVRRPLRASGTSPNPLLLPFCFAPLLYFIAAEILYTVMQGASTGALSLNATWVTSLLLAAPVTGLIIGTFLWYPEETNSITCTLYFLPVERHITYLRRVGTAVRYGLIIGVPIGLITALCAQSYIPSYANDTRFYDPGRLAAIAAEIDLIGHIRFGAFLLPYWVPATLVLSTLTAGLFRLFFRSRLLASGLAAGVWLFWCVATTMVLLAMENDWRYPLRTRDLVFQCGWCFLILSMLSGGVLWIAYCRSRLLEQSDTRRVILGLLLAPLLAGFGVFFVTANPLHITRALGFGTLAKQVKWGLIQRQYIERQQEDLIR